MTKPKNFPARKLERQMRAKIGNARPFNDAERAALDAARAVRTKKDRSGK